MLVVNPAFYFFSCILPRDKLLKISLPFKPIGNVISVYPRMSRDPKKSHRMLGGNVIQCLLELLYQWGRCLLLSVIQVFEIC